MFGADIGRAKFCRESEGPREYLFQTGRKVEEDFLLRFRGRFPYAFEIPRREGYFPEGFLFEADIFEEYLAETSLFEEEGEEDMLRFDMGAMRIESDVASLFEDAFGVEGQFFGQGKSFHRKGE